MKTIGERIRALRKARGFSRQGDLAKLVGVDQSVISDIENGAGFKADVLMALCEHLGASAEYLMLGQDNAAAGEAEILSLYRKTNDEGRAAMVAMARGLKTNYLRTEGPDSPMNMGGGRKTRESPVVESEQADTFITKNKHIELSVPNTSTRKGERREQTGSDSKSESPKRGKHVASASKTSRTGRT